MKHDMDNKREIRPMQAQTPGGRDGKAAAPSHAMHALQRKIGNQALLQLAADQAAKTGASANGPVMQRRVIEYVPTPTAPVVSKELNDDQNRALAGLIASARLKAKEIDGHVNKARDNVQKVVNDVVAGRMKVTEVAAKFPYSGHADNFQNKLMDHIGGGASVHPSAPGGYLIEDYASANMSGVGIQVTPGNLRGSRPDFMIPMATDRKGPGGNDYSGLVDATSGSSSSIGHILRKGGGVWTKRTGYPYVAESVYDPLSFGKPTRPLTDDEMEAIKARELEKQAAIENAAAEEITRLQAQYKETHDNILAYLNTGEAANMATIMRLTGSRTKSKLSVIGIDYNPETNEVETSEPFEDWVKDTYVDSMFRTPTKREKTRTLLEIMQLLP
ncbi:hypothetical protein ACFFSY_09110 [Paenibacillus aurantiacus]|uniref:Uncharacterized protein n=1 Tax=Paenibacillus aurantiacus TaxID=1936118 RepID=A0ABV5KLF9_9BACL